MREDLPQDVVDFQSCVVEGYGRSAQFCKQGLTHLLRDPVTISFRAGQGLPSVGCGGWGQQNITLSYHLPRTQEYLLPQQFRAASCCRKSG